MSRMNRIVVVSIAVLVGSVWVLKPTAEPGPLGPTPYDQRLAELDQLALDDAYRTHMVKLFGVWMGDEHGQPQRATVGANRARRAYVAVMKDREQRRQ